MEPIKFIQPSQVYYWEKCPLRAVFSIEYKDRPVFPKHPDSELGSLIHLFINKKNDWSISSVESFEKKWKNKVDEIDAAYLNNKLQKVYFPIKWNSKYFAVKKIQLKKSLLKESKSHKSESKVNILREEWRDDGKDIGGQIDYLVSNEKNEIIEIADTKTGKIFEFLNRKKVIKENYIKQLILYAHIINSKQGFYPKCYIKDIEGNMYPLEINENVIKKEIEKAVELKKSINKSIEESDFSSLANPILDCCFNCNYRPLCDQYKTKFINNFDNKRVDIFGEVVEIKGVNKFEIKLIIDGKEIVLKGITSIEDIALGDKVYIYNLYCPDGNSAILYALKETIIKNE